jgi:NADH-quinone oxidoreductase subunit F
LEILMERPLTENIRPGEEPLDIKGYEQAGGYQALRKAVLHMAPQEVSNEVKNSNLRGRGGAGFVTGQKWLFVPDGPHPKYLCVNGDEMEPGTFKDRLLLEGNPHQLIEGAIIAAYAIQADVAYIFIRGEYTLAAKRMAKAIAEAYANGYAGKNILGSSYSLEVNMHLSAGRYICGEETGLLDSLEGKRANPRTKPPFPATVGLFGHPTVVNNVETICNVSHVINKGADWFKGLSKSASGGTKLFGVSGRAKKPGVWELPLGTTIREIVDDYAGGMQDGYTLRGLLPGGASTDFILPENFDTPMDFDTVPKIGSRMGTGTMILLDDKTCPVGFVGNIEHFMAQESCGWCTPCWGGLHFIEQIFIDLEDGNGEPGDLEILQSHCWKLGPGNTFCLLAPGAVEPLQSALKFYRQDFERHISEKRCPWR